MPRRVGPGFTPPLPDMVQLMSLGYFAQTATTFTMTHIAPRDYAVSRRRLAARPFHQHCRAYGKQDAAPSEASRGAGAVCFAFMRGDEQCRFVRCRRGGHQRGEPPCLERRRGRHAIMAQAAVDGRRRVACDACALNTPSRSSSSAMRRQHWSFHRSARRHISRSSNASELVSYGHH